MTNEPEAASSGTKAVPNNPTKQREDEKYDGIWMPRCDFFSKLNWVAFRAATGGVVAATGCSIPRCCLRPPKTSKAGYPEEYGVGREDLERVAGHPADPIEVAVDTGELETFDQEGVEVGAGLRFPLLLEAGRCTGSGRVDAQRPEKFEDPSPKSEKCHSETVRFGDVTWPTT